MHVLFSRVHVLKDAVLSAVVEQTAPRTVNWHAGPSVAGEVAAAADSAKVAAAQAGAAAEAAKAAAEAGAEAGAEPSSPSTLAQPIEAADAAAPEGAEGAEGAEAGLASPPPAPAEAAAEDSGSLLTPARRAGEAAASGALAGAETLSPTPHGVGCLHEVLRFLVLLVDPNEPQNPQAVREFGLALLHVALQVHPSPRPPSPRPLSPLTLAPPSPSSPSPPCRRAGPHWPTCRRSRRCCRMTSHSDSS